MSKWMFRTITALCLIGISIFSVPIITSFLVSNEQKREIKSFTEDLNRSSEKDTLYQQMQEYNRDIYENHQSGLKDVWSYSINDTFDLRKINSDVDMIGYIEIPKLGLSIPLYIGANQKNLYKGAAVMLQTTMPIGGKNTNCVIAGHRGGYNGEQLFKNIENLENGDEIYIINPWDTLTYTVLKEIVINANDVEAIKIFENQDMITLFTCHPYGSNTHRYVVYAKRKGTEGVVNLPNGVSFEPSEKKIVTEKLVNYVLLFISIIFLIIITIKRKQELRKQNGY